MDVTSPTVLSILMDRDIVTDYASEYGEPGYSTAGFVMLGSYWCHCDHGPDAAEQNARATERGDKPHYLHGIEYHYPRIFAALESAGCELEWSDEWVVESDKAYRTSPDSYSWQSSVAFTEDGEILTPDDDIETWIEYMVDNPRRCLPRTVWSESDLQGAGFTEYQCGYESGWHPGQTDDPEEITRLIRSELGEDVEILFYLSHTGQFDIGFCAMVRARTAEDDG